MFSWVGGPLWATSDRKLGEAMLLDSAMTSIANSRPTSFGSAIVYLHSVEESILAEI